MKSATLLTLSTPSAKAAPVVKEKLLTGAEALALGIDQPFELVNGKIIYIIQVVT